MTTFTLRRQEETRRSTWGYLFGLDPNAPHLSMITERGALNPDGHRRIPAGLYRLAIRNFGESHFDAHFKAAYRRWQVRRSNIEAEIIFCW